MAVPVLHLNLVPPPTLWRRRHEPISWAVLGLGLLGLLATLGYWGLQSARATRTAKQSVEFSNQARRAAQREAALQQELAALDVTAELPRWRLAERIYQERGLPWSRATAELERSLVDGVRLKGLSRTRTTDGSVEVKVRAEARAREAEIDFIEQLRSNPLFAQVVLEREAERQGGGQDFELRLPLVAVPPPYTPLPLPGAGQAAAAGKQVKR